MYVRYEIYEINEPQVGFIRLKVEHRIETCEDEYG